MSFRTVLNLAIVIIIAVSAIASASDNPMLLKVYFDNKSEVLEILKLGVDIPVVSKNHAEVVAYPGDLQAIDKSGLAYEIIHDDLVEFYQSRNPLNLDMGGYPTYSEVIDIIDNLQASYPDIVSAKWSVGRSLQNRELWVFKISDNVDTDEDEPEVFYNSLIHAREPAGMTWQLHFAEWLCENYGIDPEATDIVDNREIFFLPVFNPDGYEYNRQTDPNGGGMWRKNRRNNGDGNYGVDLNRNWGYNWGYDDFGSSPDPGSQTYRGTAAFSEPETEVVRQFINSRSFSFIVNAHTYGDYVLYPWGYDDIYTPHHNIFTVIGDSASTLTGYANGTAWELLYNTNGDATDWQYGEQVEKPLIFCLTPETGSSYDGFWPDPDRIPVLNELMLPFGIYVAQIAANPRGIAPPVPPVINYIGEVNTDPFTVSWTHNDDYNPAVLYELMEKTGYSRTSDDFESGNGNWQLNGFSLSSDDFHSPSHSLFSGNQNNYNGNAILNEQFTVEYGDSIIFYAWYDIEIDWDYAYVEISTDGGLNFFTIPGNITTDYDPHGNNRGNGITGTSSGWTQAKFPLNSYIGSTAMVKLSYNTDGYVLESGIYVDDFSPVIGFGNETVLASDITENSFEISGRENGTYYYQVRALDADDQWSLFSNLEMAIVNMGTSISGVVTDDNTLDFIEGVAVNAVGTEPLVSDVTDINGNYFLSDLTPGIYDVSFSHIDYRDTTATDVEVIADTNTPLDVEMEELITEIPTLSEWGMIVLALLLLAFSTIAVIRRHRTADAR